MMLVSFFCSVYYNVILAWSCYYFFNSFKSVIPWVGCGHSWNTKNCFADVTNRNATANFTRPSPSREFFIYDVLQLSSGIEEPGHINWKIAACLLVAWVLVYFCIWKGIKTTGKVVYITATMPYVMLFVLFVNGLTLDGSLNGIKYYVSPKWDRILDPEVWIDAASQVFFSIAIGLGVMLTFASYNPKHNNVYRDALIISITDAMTSIFSGFVVFSILGYMAALQGKDVTDPSIATDGPGLVFIVYPAALATLPHPHVWTVIFFLMLITLGLDSQFGQVELVCACIIEQFPKKLAQRKEIVVLIVCTIMLLLGLSCVTEGGMYVFHLLDSYAAGTSILFLGITEVFVIGWLYGHNRFRNSISVMTGKHISIIWSYMWKYITPMVTIAIFLANLVQYRRLTYEGSYQYPLWADLLGWLIVLSIIFCVPAFAIKKILSTEGDILTRLKLSIEPMEKGVYHLHFVPLLPFLSALKHATLWLYFRCVAQCVTVHAI